MIIERILIVSLFTIGYCCTFWPGMIFEKVGDWLEEKLPDWLNKPLWSCYICCSFWLGTFLYLGIWHISFIDWLITIIPAMGLNAVISELTNKTEKVEIKDMPDVNIVNKEECSDIRLAPPLENYNNGPHFHKCIHCGLLTSALNDMCPTCQKEFKGEI